MDSLTNLQQTLSPLQDFISINLQDGGDKNAKVGKRTEITMISGRRIPKVTKKFGRHSDMEYREPAL